MSNFTRVNPGGWSTNSPFSSAQGNQLDIDHAKSVNGDDGGSYAGALTWTGEHTFQDEVLHTALTKHAAEIAFSEDNNNTRSISRTQQTGTGITTAGGIQLIGQPGRAVGSGNNNDGGRIALIAGTVGTGGDAPTSTDEKGQAGLIVRQWGGLTLETSRMRIYEWFFSAPLSASSQVDLDINLLDHGLELNAAYDAVMHVTATGFAVSTGGADYATDEKKATIEFDTSAPSNKYLRGPGANTTVHADGQGMTAFAINIHPVAGLFPFIRVTHHGSGSAGRVGLHVNCKVFPDVAL